MEKPKHHIFICAGFRVSGGAQGACSKKGSTQYLPYLEEELEERGMENVVVSSTGCLNNCDNGPVMIVYPENNWYGKVDSEEVVGEILDALVEGKNVEEYLLTE
jgi:(2Fe-2S) ferredoxin